MKHPNTLSMLILVVALFAAFGGPEYSDETKVPGEVPSGAPPSRSLHFTGVNLRSVGDDGVKIGIQALEMRWQKRNLGFFSVAFLWDLTFVSGRIYLDLDSARSEPSADNEDYGLGVALRETVNLIYAIGVGASTVRIEPFALEISDHGRQLFKIQSAVAELHANRGIELRSDVEVSSVSGQLLYATRAILHPDGLLIVPGGYSISEVDRGAVYRDENAVFLLLANGRIRARHSSAGVADAETVEGQTLIVR